jgi:hypothetical protein
MIRMMKTVKPLLGGSLVLASALSLAQAADARTLPGSAGVPFGDFSPGGNGDTSTKWSCVNESTGGLKNLCTIGGFGANIVVEFPLPVDTAGSYSPTFHGTSFTRCINVSLDSNGNIVGNTGWQTTGSPGAVSVPAFGALYGACEVQNGGEIRTVAY